MDWNTLEKSPHMTPLLVRLYDSHKLYEMVKDTRPRARLELTSAVTGLFEATSLTEREQDLLADVLIGLMRRAEMDLRLALAERLAGLGNVPLRLVLHLANEDILVAAPMLRKSPVLTDLDLIYIIKSREPEYWRVIAARESLSAEVIDVLADSRDPETALVLTRNDRIVLTRHAVRVLADMAEEHESLAGPLLHRPEMPPALARALYAHVGQELKTYIRAFLKENGARQAESELDSLIDAFSESTVPYGRSYSSEFMPSSAVQTAARKKAVQGGLNMEIMLDTLQKGNIAPFIALFSEYTGLPAKKIHDFLLQACPKGMAIACRAFRVHKGEFSKIYLLTQRMRTDGQLVNHKAMVEILDYFDSIRPESAARFISRYGGRLQ